MKISCWSSEKFHQVEFVLPQLLFLIKWAPEQQQKAALALLGATHHLDPKSSFIMFLFSIPDGAGIVGTTPFARCSESENSARQREFTNSSHPQKSFFNLIEPRPIFCLSRFFPELKFKSWELEAEPTFSSFSWKRIFLSIRIFFIWLRISFLIEFSFDSFFSNWFFEKKLVSFQPRAILREIVFTASTRSYHSSIIALLNEHFIK